MTNKYMNFLVVLLLSTVLPAQETTGYSVSASLVGMSMDYREYEDNGALFNTEKSDFNEITGLEAELSYVTVLENKDAIQMDLGLMVLSGETVYTGAQYDSSTGVSGAFASYSGTTLDTVLELSVYCRYKKVFNDVLELNFGVGFGDRSWRRELSPSQVEVYSWYSIRPTIGFMNKINDISFGGQIEYQYGIIPTMTLLADSENSDIKLDLGAANILQISVPVKYRVDEKIELFAEYTFEQQIIEKSNSARYIYNGVIYSIHEPRSEAYNQYLKFGATFKF